MNVLSLFDGMSCGRIGLERAGIPVTNYYASEIDKYAMKVSSANYPNIIQVGSVTELKNIDWSLQKIDLVIGGSPCQGFSFAGKQLNFDDPRSALFFEYVRILNEIRKINPDVKFLLENVKMKKEYQDIISGYLGVEPEPINSKKFVAQNRPRLYWTNISFPKIEFDKNIILDSILDAPIEKYKLSEKTINTLSRHKNKIITNPFNPEKSACIHANYFKMGGRYQQYVYKENNLYKFTPEECEKLQSVPLGYTNRVSNSQRYKMLGNGWTVDVIAHIFQGLKTTEFNNLDF